MFIPADNREDLRDVAEEVREQLEIIPVKEVSEVLRALGIRRKAPAKKNVKTA